MKNIWRKFEAEVVIISLNNSNEEENVCSIPTGIRQIRKASWVLWVWFPPMYIFYFGSSTLMLQNVVTIAVSSVSIFFPTGITTNHFSMYFCISTMIWMSKSRRQLEVAPNMTKLSSISHHLKMNECLIFLENSSWWKLFSKYLFSYKKVENKIFLNFYFN